MQHSQWVPRLTWRTATNFIFYSKFAVHNILQHYFGTGEDDKTQELTPGDTLRAEVSTLESQVSILAAQVFTQATQLF